MEVLNLGKKRLSLLFVMVFAVTSCNPVASPVSKRGLATEDAVDTTGGSSSGSTSGGGATGDDNDLGEGTSLPPKVEIRHLIEPNLSYDPTYQTGTGLASGGSYVRKMTLPKNFAGKLYVAGINMGTLSNRHVRVRFKWGVNRKAIPEDGIPATVVQAPGITPQTPISVLVLDLKSEPFRSVRLPYDLFDYNDYDFSAGDTPVQDNRDTGLYCRGLQVADDPTFVGVGACDGLPVNPDQPEEECLYAYAKVADQGLVRQVGSGAQIPITPSLTQTMSFVGTSYYQDFFAKNLLKPLPDTMLTSSSFTASTFTFSDTNSSTGSPSLVFPAASIWDEQTVGSSTTKYFYRGPYRLMDSRNWQFRFQRPDGAKRLFKENSYVNFDSSKGAVPDRPEYITVNGDGSLSFTKHEKIFYNSYLFPLATKLKIGAGVGYLGSSGVEGRRDPTSLGAAGETLMWMDGANARVQSRDSELNHIGSCNVSSSIEIIAKDDNGVEYTISSALDVKLQLVRPTVYRTDIGNEVLYTNFRSCSANSNCGSSECCINGRCWDETLVSQCFDENDVQGNKPIGRDCASDLECSSLCCSTTSGQCSAHNTSLNPAVLCSKPVGSFCIAKEWCSKTPVTKCIVVSQPNDPVTGEARCVQSCYTVWEYGDCKNSACVPATQPSIPVFNENDPNRCDNAVPAPDFSN